MSRRLSYPPCLRKLPFVLWLIAGTLRSQAQEPNGGHEDATILVAANTSKSVDASRRGGGTLPATVEGSTPNRLQGVGVLSNRLAQRALTFIENRGQFPEQVKFKVASGGRTVWLTNCGVVLDLPSDRTAAHDSGSSARLGGHYPPQTTEPRSVQRLAIYEELRDANPRTEIEAKTPQPGIYNYFVGNDSKKWRTDVKGYGEVVYRDVWEGIDLRLYGSGRDLEQEFVVAPGADLSRVRVAYKGIETLSVSADGSLRIRTAFGELHESSPNVYQEIKGKRVAVKARFRLTDEKAYTFAVDHYRPEYALVIDPTLLYSTYLGGSAGVAEFGVIAEIANGIAVDSSGSAYVTGFTGSTDFPTTPGAYQSSSNTPNSGFVTKLSPLGDQLVYSTYLGSGGQVAGEAIAVDSSGSAYVTGYPDSGFPTTTTAYSTGCNDGNSYFVTKLTPAGDNLMYSTCIGGHVGLFVGGGPEMGLALDASGKAYVTGSANCNLPATPGAFQTTCLGLDASVFVIDPSASGAASLVYATYLHGTNNSSGGLAIAVDTYGDIYVTGATDDSGFPVTAGAYQTTFYGNPCADQGQGSLTGGAPCASAFVAKLNPNVSGESSLIYATYVGGTNSSRGQSIAVDSGGSAYITGYTGGFGPPIGARIQQFPSTTDAFFPCGTSGATYAFVTKLNAAGNALSYSTCLGGSPADFSPGGAGTGIALDVNGDAYVTGTTRSSMFPLTPNALQSTSYGDPDGFVTELNPTGSGLVYSSYLGGPGGDTTPTAIAIDPAGDVYIAGFTSSASFPVTPSAFRTGIDGNGDAFITKFPLAKSGAFSITNVLPNVGGTAGTVSSEIFGTGFHSGATVQLIGPSQVSGSSVVVGSEGRTITTSFDLTSATPGVYSVVVTNPGGTSSTLAKGFTIQQGGGPQLRVSIVGPGKIATGHGPVTFTVFVQNTGNADVVGVVLSVYGIPSEAQLRPIFDISPIPAMIGQQPLDFSQFPFAPVVGQQQIPTLLISDIPAGSSIALPFTLAISSLPPTPPLQPMPPPHGLAPRSGSGSAINITAVLTTLDKFCTAGDGNCVLVALKQLIPIGGCLTDLLCFNINALLNPNEFVHGGVFNFNEFFLQELISTSPSCIIETLIGAGLLTAGVPVVAAGVIAGAIGGAVSLIFADCVQTANEGEGFLPVGAAVDPNDKEGLTGAGLSRWVSGTGPLLYSIYFLNEPNATAAAEGVVLTDTLDPSLDLSTLSLNSIAVGGMNIPVPSSFQPAVGQNQASTFADFRPAQSLLVNVDVSLNPASRVLNLQFASTDPTTGLPPANPLIGVLPPGVEASATYSVKSMPLIATGTQISNQANIVFDTNPAMNTQNWVNTIDNTPPVSHVSALPTTSTCPAFRVGWSGNDVGSGLQGFTIYVSDNGGPFAAWISNAIAASADYQGSVGHAYSFYSIATDLTGNVEAAKTLAEASTMVTAAGPCGPPSLSGQVSTVSQSGATVTVSLQLTNTGFTAAQALNIVKITPRTLSGSGAVTLTTPMLPAVEGSLAIGASATVTLTLNVPSTVTRFSLTESGNIQDGAGNTYNYSIAQTVIP